MSGVFGNSQDFLLKMDTEIFQIDAPWAEKLTKMRVQFLLTPTVFSSYSGHLHEECEEGQHEDDPGQDEGDDVVGEVDVVLVAAGPGAAQPEVEHAALAARHRGHRPRPDRRPHPHHPRQRDRPLVHAGAPAI